MKKNTKLIIAGLSIMVVVAVVFSIKYYVSDATSDYNKNANQLANI